MKIITSKVEIKTLVAEALSVFKEQGIDAFIANLHDSLLKRKVRYPLLEFAARQFFDNLPAVIHLDISDRIICLKENGSEVIAGIILQLRLPDAFEESVIKAVEYIELGQNWLTCDTVGERVMGHGLLTQPEPGLQSLVLLSRHDSKWIVRSVGVAIHYAVKKGLRKEYVEKAFRLLLSLASSTDFHVRKGVGWGVKTISKFHPDIVAKYRGMIDNDPEIRQWFRSKINIGLGRAHKYAGRY